LAQIKEFLQNFIQLKISNWETLTTLSEIDTTGSFLLDWQQANWELLVEGFIDQPNTIVLECYGNGADCNGASSRVLFPELRPTHRLICTPKANSTVKDYLTGKEVKASNIEIIFDRFVTFGNENWYSEAPPFDKILGEYKEREVTVDFDALEFKLQTINS